jgi:hypothetical protein
MDKETKELYRQTKMAWERGYTAGMLRMFLLWIPGLIIILLIK